MSCENIFEMFLVAHYYSFNYQMRTVVNQKKSKIMSGGGRRYCIKKQIYYIIKRLMKSFNSNL